MLALMVMGVASYVRAGEPTDVVKVNPVKHGNVIRGHVIEKSTEDHLPYAAILIVETGEGTVSDDTGHFGFKNLPEGTYTLRVAVGMSRKCNDFTVTLTPENRFANAKVWIKPGFWANSFVIEPATAEEMPE